MIRGQNRIHLSSEQLEESLKVEPMPQRRVRLQVFLREPKQTHRRIEAPSILGVSRARMLFLQVHKTSRGLDQAFEKIRVFVFRAQPEVLEHVMCFVVALLVPAPKKAEITGMFRNRFRSSVGRCPRQLLHQPGNSLVFAHGKFNLVSAEMTGNRAGRLFAREGSRADGAADAG